MTRILYGLLVGIDRYAGAVPDLEGCGNDVAAIRELVATLGSANSFGLQIVSLLDEQATRTAVIATFRSHLGQAAEKDVVLFYFSGHGSQEKAAADQWHAEPDRLNETLVLHDSRLAGSWDLADKELGALLREVSSRRPHVVVVLDCCHAGSGTRENAHVRGVRSVARDSRPRASGSWLTPPGSRGGGPGEARVPEPFSHVLMAACAEEELAREVSLEGQRRGVFSVSLQSALRGARGRLTYRDLVAHAGALVRGQFENQCPQLESVGGASLDALFLDGTRKHQKPTFTAFCREASWMLNAGAVHGLPELSHDDGIEKRALVYLYLYDADDQELADGERRVCAAQLVEVAAATSRLLLLESESLDPRQTYKARVVSTPLQRLPVEVQGDDRVAAKLRSRLMGSEGSLYVRLAADGEVGETRVRRSGSWLSRSYEIVDVGGLPLLSTDASSRPDVTAMRMLTFLEHHARWQVTARLKNPFSSIADEEIHLSIWVDGQRVDGPEYHLKYSKQGQAPEFKIEVENRSQRKLYFGLLDLTEKLEISTALQSGRPCIALDPGGRWQAFEGKAVVAKVPDEIWQTGVNYCRDIVKLIVSTETFDARLLEQGALNDPRQSVAPHSPRPQGALDRLLQQIQHRDSQILESVPYDDWCTREALLICHRPRPAEG